MSTYLMEIDGVLPLDEIERQIAFEEASSSEFVRSSVTAHEGRLTNIATYLERLPGTIPPRARLTLDTDPPPGTLHEVWRGAMLVSGTNRMVVLWRP